VIFGKKFRDLAEQKILRVFGTSEEMQSKVLICGEINHRRKSMSKQ
jgi:hypothetical protein